MNQHKTIRETAEAATITIEARISKWTGKEGASLSSRVKSDIKLGRLRGVVWGRC